MEKSMAKDGFSLRKNNFLIKKKKDLKTKSFLDSLFTDITQHEIGSQEVLKNRIKIMIRRNRLQKDIVVKYIEKSQEFDHVFSSIKENESSMDSSHII